MILHIGCDEFLPLSCIVAVLDFPCGGDADPARPPFVPQGASVRRVGTGPVKSVIVTATGEQRAFFLSPISAQTLRKRLERGPA